MVGGAGLSRGTGSARALWDEQGGRQPPQAQPALQGVAAAPRCLCGTVAGAWVTSCPAASAAPTHGAPHPASQRPAAGPSPLPSSTSPTPTQESAQRLVVPNAYAQALTSVGAVGLNASTSHDAT